MYDSGSVFEIYGNSGQDLGSRIRDIWVYDKISGKELSTCVILSREPHNFLGCS